MPRYRKLQVMQPLYLANFIKSLQLINKYKKGEKALGRMPLIIFAIEDTLCLKRFIKEINNRIN
jgi:hypothetical protein